MGALANAVELIDNVVWSKWLRTAGVYQARVVLAEPTSTPEYATRRELAQRVIANPEYLVPTALAIITTDPVVASAGATPEAVTESRVLSKIAEHWTIMATSLVI